MSLRKAQTPTLLRLEPQPRNAQESTGLARNQQLLS